ncbi:MAG: universal stress protein [Myxococcales bacterium]|nr:universal stress protein [Myxococcales bacterium]
MPPPSAGQRPVLCAVDFEASSWRALGFAVSVARQTAQPLHIVHVSDPGPEVDWDHLDPAIAPALRELEALLEARVERAHGLLARASAACARAGVTAQTHLATGRPPEAIIEAGERHAAGLIVVGAHNAAERHRVHLLGSTAERVLRAAQVSVLVVPGPPPAPKATSGARVAPDRPLHAGAAAPSDDPLTGDPAMALIQRILCPTDFSDSSDAAIEYSLSLAETLGAEVHLLHVYPIPALMLPDGGVTATAQLVARLSEHANDAMDAHVARLTERGAKVTGHVTEGVAAQSILDAAEEIGADLIVMATHGRTGLAHLLVGSVTERVVRLSTIPVLTVRTHAPT